MSNPAQLSLFLSITLTFSTSLMSAYGDDYGCENSTILGTSYYTSWTPTSITTAEGSCSSEDVYVDLAGIVAGTLLLMGAIWFIAPDASADEESKILKLYKSESRFGIAFQALPEKYYLRAGLNSNKRLNFNKYTGPVGEPNKSFGYYSDLLKSKLSLTYLFLTRF